MNNLLGPTEYLLDMMKIILPARSYYFQINLRSTLLQWRCKEWWHPGQKVW